MTTKEAAMILGVTTEEVKRLQETGNLPDPIPDDYLDPVMEFRVKLEQAHRRKMDRFSRGENDGSQ